MGIIPCYCFKNIWYVKCHKKKDTLKIDFSDSFDLAKLEEKRLEEESATDEAESQGLSYFFLFKLI